MKFGLSGRGGGVESAGISDLGAFAQLAERLGYDSMWINEEHFRPPGMDDLRVCVSPIVLAAFLAGQTTRLRFGFSVLLLPLHQPLRLAEEIATLDALSGGRVDFGISRANNERYVAAFAFDPAENTRAFRDGLDFILRCWTQPSVSIGNAEYTIEPRPIQRPHPPVYIGAYSEESVRWTGHSGHTLLQTGIQSLARIRTNLRMYAEEGGNVRAVPVGRFIYVGDSDAAARREAWPVVAQLTNRLRSIGIHRRGNIIDEADLDPEQFYHEVAIIGGPEACAERVAELREHLGVDSVNLLASFFSYLPADLLRLSLERFAAEIMPRFRD
jgi:alkanesulfonate monooxygenase SsuD/methylene tetrahydromethanopterin reductase-like flavin-dependent oxidoreductase (luciferase family)